MASGTGGRHTPEAVGDTAVAGGNTAAATRATDAMTPLDKDSLETSIIGQTLSGRYLVTRKVGQGGMGAVYEATHTLIGKRVAVKVLLEKYARREAIVQRLEQEARLASSVGNEHIIDITDFGHTEDGRTFVVMEFLDGESLAECLAREQKLPEQRIVAITAQAASALAAAHEKGIVHRDIKPENLFLLRRNDRDFVKVVDFGISKSLRASGDDEDQPRLTQTGMVLGTPLYMSPEQARGDEELDARVDIYALGVIMYEAGAGRVPFSGTNYLSVISQVLNEEPPPLRDQRPELTEEFEAIVSRAMAKNRADRYASATDLLADLQMLQDDPTHSTERAKITGPRKRVAKKGHLRIGAWIAVVAVIIAAVVVTATMLLGGEDKKKQKRTQPVALVPDAAPAPPPPDGPPVPEANTRELTIDSEPRGAQILEDGSKDRGTTPSTFRIVVHDRPTSFTATLDGYEDSTISVNPLVDGLDGPVKIRLKKLKKGAPPPPPHKIIPAAGSAAAGSAQPVDKTHGEIDKPDFGNLVPKDPKKQ